MICKCGLCKEYQSSKGLCPIVWLKKQQSIGNFKNCEWNPVYLAFTLP